jgi:hypothetical protein
MNKDNTMMVFANVATNWEKKLSKTTQKSYWQGRIAESQRGIDSSPTFYTVRLMVDKDPGLKLGDFVRVTGKLKCDFYVGKDGKPTGSLLIIAFEAFKVEKHAPVAGAAAQGFEKDTESKEAQMRQSIPTPPPLPRRRPEQERQEELTHQPEPLRGQNEMRMFEWTD